MSGWVWGAAYVIAMAFAVAYCAALEHLDRTNKFSPVRIPWEGDEAESNHPVSEETA